jgi:hypothetical protein
MQESRVILDAQQLKRITEIVRNASRPLSVRDISQSMFAMGKYSSSNPSHGFVQLTEALRGSEGRLQGREIGDILNSLRGKRSRITHSSSAEAADSKLAQFDSEAFNDSLSMTLYRLDLCRKGAEEERLQEDLVLLDFCVCSRR